MTGAPHDGPLFRDDVDKGKEKLTRADPEEKRSKKDFSGNLYQIGIGEGLTIFAAG